MANLPLVDTMHHALQAWCIFAEFLLTPRDKEDKRDKMRCTSQEPSSRRTFFRQPEAALQQIPSWISLENTQKKRAKTHACVFNARVRFFILSCDTWLLRLFPPVTVARHLLTFAGSDMPEKVSHARVSPHLHE